MKRRILALLLTAAAVLLSGCGQSPSPAPVSEPSETTEQDPLPESVSEPDPLPEPAPEPAAEDFVPVADYLPQVRVDLRYAGSDNFTGQTIYDFTDAYLRYDTVQKLSQAQEALEEAGYSLLIWDAFRPVEAQFRLWEVCPDPVYVANPEKGYSSHSRGNTVDVTLTDLA